MKTRVSIVEDDQPTREALAGIVAGAPDLELVSQYARAEEAVRALPVDRPDVVLTDINLPDRTGGETVRELKPRMAGTQFLMLTVYEDSEHIFAALAAGATGYLLKGTRREELLEAIAQVMAGGSPMSSAIARKVVQSFARPVQPSAAPAKSEVEGLSPREQSVLALLAKGFLYKEIVESLGVSGPTVSTYVRRIYEKLQVHSRTQAINKYLGKG
jgi:DNA-binding NarL/FixJ family response regulator